MKILKISILMLAFAGIFATDVCAQTDAQGANKTSSVTASPEIRQLCGLLDEFCANIRAGKKVNIDELTNPLNDVSPEVGSQQLTQADKELLKKTMSNFVKAAVHSTLADQGLRYDALDASAKEQIDLMLKTSLDALNQVIDKSNTIDEIGQMMQSF